RHSFSFEVAYHVYDDPLIVKTSSKGRPAFNLKRHREQRVCGTVCTAKIFRCGQSRLYLWETLRHAIHAVIEQDDVRIIVDTPDMSLTIAARVGDIAVCFPIG